MLVILEILEIIPPEENFFLVLMTYKLLTEAEIEGGFLLVGDQWSLKKKSNTKTQSRAALVYNKKTFTIHSSKKIWATFRKRDLDFFVFKSTSESPFYQVGEQKNPPGSY